jgi:hypothetical protein
LQRLQIVLATTLQVLDHHHDSCDRSAHFVADSGRHCLVELVFRLQ